MLNIQQSNKEQLAKLMATENITVIHRKVSTAYFDVKSRTLCIPILKDDMSSELVDLFTGHEVGHALYTPVDGWHDSVCEKGGLFKGYLNVIEDCRIEEMVKNKYPGLRRSFYKGYEELAFSNFFGIQGKDLSKLNLIDKINIHFKIGAQARVQFSNEERPYIIRCKNLKNFDEVMELATELFERQEQMTDEQMESMTQEQLEELIKEFGFEESEESGDETSESQISLPSDEGEEECESSPDNCDGNADGEKSDEEAESGAGDEGEETEEESTESGDSSRKGGKSPEERAKDQLNKSVTDEEFRKNEDRVYEDQDDYRCHEATHFEIERKIKYENFTVPWTEIDDVITNRDNPEGYRGYELNRRPVTETVKTFMDSNKKIVAYMVKQFEMKKAAADYKRSWAAKTGELNMDRLHLYQLKDDIFNRIQVVPDGKNHGIVMVVDWSGSMTGSVLSTVEQAALLSMFCRRLSIPFRLFAFSDGYYRKDQENRNIEMRDKKGFLEYGSESIPGPGMHSLEVGHLSLLEMFNEKMSNTEFVRSMENWFQLAASADGYGWYGQSGHDRGRFDSDWSVPYGLQLSGTPFDATLVVMRDYLIDFKKNYGLDICSFVALTDGQSHRCFHGFKPSLVDRKRNKVFENVGNTKGLLEWLSKTTGARTIGFYLTKATGHKFFSEAYSFCGTQMNGYDDVSMMKKKEFTNLATSFEDGYYDLSIVINQKKISIDYDADELNVDVGATKGKLKNALVKAGTNKMKQRVILNQFVDQMAV